jgi:hypothetical protein
MGRSGDHTAVIVAANDSSGNVAIFAGNGAARAGPQSIGSGSISWVAANSDGSRLAVVLASSGATKLVLLDGIKLGIGGKPAMATLVDMNTLSVVSPAVTAGPQRLTLTNATARLFHGMLR